MSDVISQSWFWPVSWSRCCSWSCSVVMYVRNGSGVDCPGSWSWSRFCSWSCSGVMCVRNGSGVDCPGSGRVHRQRLGRWCLLHHPPTHAFRAVCTTSPLVLLCHKYASVLLCATLRYLQVCRPLCELPLVTAKSKSKDLSPAQRATAGLSKGSFTTSGKTARNPNFFGFVPAER